MELQISKCKECLLAELQPSGSFYCIHPDGNQYIPSINEEVGFPALCPLKWESLTISIKKD